MWKDKDQQCGITSSFFGTGSRDDIFRKLGMRKIFCVDVILVDNAGQFATIDLLSLLGTLHFCNYRVAYVQFPRTHTCVRSVQRHPSGGQY